MIYGADKIGKELSQIYLAKEFRKCYQKLSTQDNELIQNFFLYNSKIELQFDGLLMLYTNLCADRPNFSKENSHFDDFIMDKCGRLSVILKIIIHNLNILKIDDSVYNIVDNPFDHGELADEQDINKESIDNLINENSEQIYQTIKILKKRFFNSKLLKNYCNALRTDTDLKLFELNIQSLFYIIKQIIYQSIRDGEIKEINESNIIKFNRDTIIDGDFFDIKFQPTKVYVNTNEIVRIIYEDNEYYGFVTLMTFSFSKEKGTLIRIKGEILKEDGLNLKSTNNIIIDEHIKRYY